MLNRYSLLLGMLAAIASFSLHSVCVADTAQVAVRQNSPSVTVVSTGNTCGSFEPCHCPTNPYGGVPRRATLISEFRKENPNLILLDSGNVFDSSTSQAYGDLLTWAYRLCSYDAVALGSLDVMCACKVGALRFKSLGVPWVCGNMESGSGEFGVVRYRLLERGGKRIAITVLLGTRLINSDVLRQGTPPVTLTNPVTALQTLADELRPKADNLYVTGPLKRF